VGLVPDLVGLPGIDQSGRVLVEVRASVHVRPERFSVLGVIATSEVLFTTIVIEGDSSGSHGEDQGTLIHVSVTLGVQEPGIVVVVDKDTQGIDVIESAGFSVESSPNGVHTFPVHPDILDCIVHRIVKESSHIVLVLTHIAIVSIETLAHLEDARSSSETRPETLGHFGDRVDPDSIKTVLRDHVSNPVLQVLGNVGVLLVQVRQTAKSAVLNLVLVSPIINIAVRVVMSSLI
jgi:hypothetical protein